VGGVAPGAQIRDHSPQGRREQAHALGARPLLPLARGLGAAQRAPRQAPAR